MMQEFANKGVHSCVALSKHLNTCCGLCAGMLLIWRERDRSPKRRGGRRGRREDKGLCRHPEEVTDCYRSLQALQRYTGNAW